MEKFQVISLAELKVGKKGVVSKVEVKPACVQRRLFEMGIIEGTIVMVGQRAPFGDPVCVRVKDYNLCLRKNILEQIKVSVAV